MYRRICVTYPIAKMRKEILSYIYICTYTHVCARARAHTHTHTQTHIYIFHIERLVSLGLFWRIKILPWILLNVILRKRLTVLQTVTVCLHVFSQFLKLAKLYFPDYHWLCNQKGTDTDKEIFCNNTVCQWVWAILRSYWDNKSVTSKWNKCVTACVTTQ